jgi:hypothetical protein
MPRERVEIDPVGHLLDVAQTVGKGAGQNLLNHRHRLVEVVGRRNRRRDFLAVFGV